MIPFEHVIALSAALFVVGASGVLVRRNLLAVLMSIELMLTAANLAFVGFNRAWVEDGAGAAALDGQAFALVVIAVGAAQTVVGLSIVVAMFRKRGSLDLEEASLLRW